MPEPITTAIVAKVLTNGTYDLIKHGVKEIKELFGKEGHTITEVQAKEIVHQIQTGDLIQQINNGTVNDIENYLKNDESWQQIIHGDYVAGDKISIQNGDYVAGNKEVHHHEAPTKK